MKELKKLAILLRALGFKVEVENETISFGDGAVVVQITGELKVKSVKIDPEYVDLEDIHELEHWIEIAIRDGMAKAQEIAAEKMKPLMGLLSLLIQHWLKMVHCMRNPLNQ
jgi:DNA-binding protein YbaB